MSEVLDMMVTVRFRCNNMVDQETLVDEYDNDPLEFMKDMTSDSSIFEFVTEELDVVSAKQAE